MPRLLPIFVCLLSPLAAGAQLRPAGPPFPINTFAPGSPILPNIASDAQGRFVITWTSPDVFAGGPFPSQDGDRSAIIARRFDSAGEPLGPEILVNTTTAGAQIGSSITLADDGRFVIAWSDSRRVFFQRFDAQGGKLGGETTVFASSDGNAFGLLTGNIAGDFAVVVLETHEENGNFTDTLRAHFYTADGTALAVHPLAEACPGSTCSLARSTSLANGDHLLAWFDSRNAGLGQRRVLARRFSPGGDPMQDVDLFADGNPSPIDLSLAAAPDGGFVAAWSAIDSGFSEGQEIFARRFDAAGEPLGPAVPVRADFGLALERFPTSPTAAVLEDGSFVVGWWETDYTLLPGRYIYRQPARWFDAESRSLGDDFDIAGALAPDELYLNLAALPGNRLAATWTSGWELGPSLDGDGASIAARILTAPRRGARACAVAGGSLRCDLDGDGAFEYELALDPAFSGTSIFANLDGDGRPDLCTVEGNRFRCDLGSDGGAPEIDRIFGPASSAGLTPLIVDPNGDGRDDFGLVRQRQFSFDTAHNGGSGEVKVLLDTQPGDLALAGDLDGDGDDEPCLARGTRFLCDLSHDGAIDLAITFGLGLAGGDAPRLADADGNGSDDPCVLRAGHLLCDTAHDGGGAEIDLLLPPGATNLVLGNPFRN